MTSSKTSPAPWFENLLRQCLATIVLLNLEGSPAADMIGKTAALWVRLLWDKPHGGWREDLDARRIRKAFEDIANTCRRFPSPEVFWSKLPPRPAPNPKTTIGPGWGREREREALEARDRWLASLGLNQAGEPINPQEQP